MNPKTLTGSELENIINICIDEIVYRKQQEEEIHNQMMATMLSDADRAEQRFKLAVSMGEFQ